MNTRIATAYMLLTVVVIAVAFTISTLVLGGQILGNRSNGNITRQIECSNSMKIHNTSSVVLKNCGTPVP